MPRFSFTSLHAVKLGSAYSICIYIIQKANYLASRTLHSENSGKKIVESGKKWVKILTRFTESCFENYSAVHCRKSVDAV